MGLNTNEPDIYYLANEIQISNFFASFWPGLSVRQLRLVLFVSAALRGGSEPRGIFIELGIGDEEGRALVVVIVEGRDCVKDGFKRHQ